MKKIKKAIDIHAPKENVWQVLTEDRYNRSWYNTFSEGTKAETDWQLGSKVLFSDDSGNGIIGKIVTNKPAEFLSIEYTGMILNGKENYEHKDAKAVMGAHETYMISENGPVTRLSIACDMNEEWLDSMSAAWDKALLKVKVMAENIQA